MVIGSVLLQPQRLERAAAIPPDDAILGDLIALGVRLMVDGSGRGRVVAALGASGVGTVDRLISHTSAGSAQAVSSLQTLFAPLISPFQTVAAKPPGDLSGMVERFGEGLSAFASALQNLTPDKLRGVMMTFFDVLQGDLGITPTFIRDLVVGFFDDMILALQAAPRRRDGGGAREPPRRRRASGAHQALSCGKLRLPSLQS
ncbi:MAG: hypothetical protein IPK19_10865 [Chloroflexi bacterium]|nr:hypothetical protein [Chloroflexota bacterium]